jgi:hypothetical protein
LGRWAAPQLGQKLVASPICAPQFSQNRLPSEAITPLHSKPFPYWLPSIQPFPRIAFFDDSLMTSGVAFLSVQAMLAAEEAVTQLRTVAVGRPRTVADMRWIAEML